MADLPATVHGEPVVPRRWPAGLKSLTGSGALKLLERLDRLDRLAQCGLICGMTLCLPLVQGQTSAAGSASAATQTLPALAAQQVSPSAWVLEGLAAAGSSANQNFISNASFVIAPTGVVVIDALGSPALAERMLLEIRKVTALPVTHVIVTHYHADHIYGLQVFKAAGARIIAHRAALAYVGSDTARQRLAASRDELAPWVDAATRVVAADEWLDGQEDRLINGLRFVIKPFGPSHTPEDLAIFLPQDKVLFTGDLVFRNRLPFIGQADSNAWIKALDALLALAPAVMVPGHGPVSKSADRDIHLTRNYLTHLRASMGQAAKNLDPFEDAYAAADWSQFESLPLFRLINRMNAYNTYLLMERTENQ